MWGISVSLFAQVGINTTDPKAQLDIASSSESTPTITDGILIPRINNFPASSPSADQDGMMVFLAVGKEGFPAGFYYWNHSAKKWTSIAGTVSTNFYKLGTTEPSSNIKDPIYRSGNTGIGAQAENVKMKVVLSPDDDQTTRTALEVDNASSSPKSVTYGILNNNRSITADKKYGIKNNVSAEGTGTHYGFYNETYQNTNEEIYGIYNLVGKTFGATRNHYGIFSQIGTVQGTGMVYGVYSSAQGNDPRKVYAGYFAGRVGIGFSPSEEYILPGSRGEQEQILVLDNAGNMNWRYPNTKNYTSTTSAVGDYVIPDDVHTLRINNQVSSITIPDAAANKGRIILLLGWPGISQKQLNFIGGNDLFDITTNSSINTISGGQRYKIQSAGNRWILIDK